MSLTTRCATKASKVAINVGHEWFDLIASGEKTIEGRYLIAPWSHLKRGDLIRFTTKIGSEILCVECVILDITVVGAVAPEVYLKLPGCLETLAPGMSYEQILPFYSEYENVVRKLEHSFPPFAYFHIETTV